jgi:sugar/nucleoside kinase (ribokinase family)
VALELTRLRGWRQRQTRCDDAPVPRRPSRATHDQGGKTYHEEATIAEASFDACVIGPVARDINTIGEVEHAPRPGGAAYYSTMVYIHLGLRAAVLTKVAAADEPVLLEELRGAGATVVNRATATTTTFRNIYPVENADARLQRVDARAEPLRCEDLPPIRARIWQIGPLTDQDVDPAIIARCAEAGGAVGIDLQGLTRRIVAGKVEASDPLRGADQLHHVDVLKADEEEILSYTGGATVDEAIARVRAAGAREVLITRGSRGSVVFADGAALEVEPVPPRRIADATGCGDTYLAAYMAHRLTGAGRAECARFASAAASLNIETLGAFRGSAADIAARLGVSG